MRLCAQVLGAAVLLGVFASSSAAEEPGQSDASWQVVYPRHVLDSDPASALVPLSIDRRFARGRFGLADDSKPASLFGGLRGNWERMSWDAGALYRVDRGPQAGFGNNEFGDEFGVGVAIAYDFDIMSARAGMTYLPESGDGRDTVYYPTFGLNVPLGGFATLSGQVAVQQSAYKSGGSPSFDYSIGASADIEGFDVEVKWAEADDPARGAVFFAVKRNF